MNNIDVSYQYKANPIYLYQLVIQFQDFDNYRNVLNASGFLSDKFNRINKNNQNFLIRYISGV